MNVRTLFDPNRDLYRRIEKVITYGASQDSRLKEEVSEYIATDSIEEQLESLLSKIQVAMEAGGANEVGVWVSGFYGSGKSSFTKYLGLAFDDNVVIDGQPFRKHLENRLHKPQTRALLETLAQRYPATVVMLDLASQQIAGASAQDVSMVLYYKVLQWAGYSRNLKVVALERKLQKDNRYEEFQRRFAEKFGAPWAEYQNDPLVVDSALPVLAHEFYPDLFPTENSFSTTDTEIIYLQDDLVTEMIEIIRRRSGREHIFFIIDEVGQYVGGSTGKILDLQGLAENLKKIGDGKVWLIATAQQTLTEDDPRAALNSPQLYKLQARFPIMVDLESRDIKEICYRRLLGKSADGERTLGTLFDAHGQSLRHNTRLQDAKFYDADFDRQTFINLYPFLPAHFDILLHLLGALAKSTGGIGLRSAIKVIQDILIEGTSGQSPVADKSVGWLATTVTLYDSLERDIRSAFPSIHQAVGKALLRLPDSALAHEVAKSVAVLQILGNLPITVQNLTSLMHPGVEAASRQEEVAGKVAEMLRDTFIPLGEKSGNLFFQSEKLNDIDAERAQIVPRQADMRRIFSEALRELFDPLPKAQIHGTLAVTAGIKAQNGGQTTMIAGEREPLQFIVSFADAADYTATTTSLVDESRHNSSNRTVLLLGYEAVGSEDLVREIARSQRVVDIHRNDPDTEIREYCASQTVGAAERGRKLQAEIRRSLEKGTFIFRGQATAVSVFDSKLGDASRKQLADAGEQVFERYVDAPHRADTSLAEKFLRTQNLAAITSQLDPLGLVHTPPGGTPYVDVDHKALVAICDYIDRSGTVEGKQVLDYFTGAPFGWSQDTLRYLVAALLVAGQIKLKVSGRDIVVVGQQGIDALKSNNAFRSVGVSLRQDRPAMEVLGRAAKRLTELTGEDVLPLEERIGKEALKFLPRLAGRVAPLAVRLDALNLPGKEIVDLTNRLVEELVFSDGSDAPQMLGGEESALASGLRWSLNCDKALNQGLIRTIEDLRAHQGAIRNLPSSGVPAALRQDVEDTLSHVDDWLKKDDFIDHAADLATALTTLQTRVAKAVGELATQQKARIDHAEAELALSPEWSELTAETQANATERLKQLVVAAPPDLDGLRRLITNEYDIQSAIDDLKRHIQDEGRALQRRRAQEERERQKELGEEKPRLVRKIPVPSVITTPQQLDGLVTELQKTKADLAFWGEFEITLTPED